MVLRRTAITAAVTLGSLTAGGQLLGDEPSLWSGVYTNEQASRGEALYPSICGRCHGYRLDGAADDPDMFPTPPIAGDKFLRNWNGSSLAALFEYTRTTMPEINPGSLSDEEFAAVIAYMLAVTGIPSGTNELPTDLTVLADLRIEPER